MTDAVKQKFDRRYLWIVAVLVLLLVFYGVHTATREQLNVRVARVTRGDLVSQISTNGKVEPQNNYEVHSPVAAILKTLNVHEGQRVKQGDLLLRLDDTEARSRLASALAAVKGAQATLGAMQQGGSQDERLSLTGDLSRTQIDRDQAARDLAALEKLQQSGAASASEVTTARQRLELANNSMSTLHQRQTARYGAADLDHTRAALADAQAAYGAALAVVTQCNIRAPFAGTVYSLPVSKTEFVEQGRLLLQMADLTRIQVKAYFDEPELGKLALGQPIRIAWDATPGRTWRGQVARIPSTVITYTTRNVGEVLVSVDESDGSLLPNTNVTVTVTTQHEDSVLSIPREALHTESGRAFVFILRNDKLHRTPVKLGTINLTQVGIVDGLADGDVVALGSTNGQILTDGAPARVAK